MAKSSASMETIKVSSVNEGLTSGQEMRQNAVRNNEYEQAKYLVLPQDHFCTDVTYNNTPYKSKRVVIVKLDNNNKPEYPRTWKINYFTESLAAPKEGGAPHVQTETRDGHIRVQAGALSFIPSTTSRIPKSVVTRGGKKMLHIDAPFVMDFLGTRDGYIVSYKEANGGWDVETNADGSAKFQLSRITQFEVDRDFEITDALIAEAKACIANDPQLGKVKVD